jgi:hypothetical protein
LAETGMLGALAWIYLLGILFFSCWRIVKRSKERLWQGISFGLMGGIIVFMTGGMFWLITAFVYDTAMLAFLFALVFSSERVLSHEALV